ncbi:hypothetical protein A2973_04325 [Candidatus Gottesmanbacteria bacterium RIFCSPLOWO2_01_FULL_49_10]|uniref:Uncharacterized protein n=1 Tax=Candidatus Gottesmanbacteria bacterium RIFCSPLOWO2_01_FULL_49_10 TaxID=1798396 RepID=A0A1F6AW28_9BACT|nr:MAG: hypothetical protein A2973_04325 [Candidatus Gottesmanbacteria bacterium RIFCSPLOWO2_01_FULL_49_10]
MSEIPKKISLDELKPGETFGLSKNLPHPEAIPLSEEEVITYLRASPRERQSIEIAGLGYPITPTVEPKKA